MFQTIVKRDGREVPYDISKIDAAIAKAMEASGRSAKAAPEAFAQGGGAPAGEFPRPSAGR